MATIPFGKGESPIGTGIAENTEKVPQKKGQKK